MGTVTNIFRVKFSIGDVVHHRLFNYRGVIIDVDKKFQAEDEWYEAVAKSRPPKNKPWYHILVNESIHITYVAEKNVELDKTDKPVDHPMLAQFFSKFEQGKYIKD